MIWDEGLRVATQLAVSGRLDRAIRGAPLRLFAGPLGKWNGPLRRRFAPATGSLRAPAGPHFSSNAV